ncbi:MAG TPA: hypothetical protein VHX65_12530 [Pirellulales bacterium]|nr:hypothetical protein [Pirellulales bacterium]
MRKLLLSTLSLALLLAGNSQLKADELKPVVVVSLPSYDSLSADLNFIAQVADMPELPKQFEQGSAQLNGGQGIKGLDKTKPIGLALVFDAGGQPKFVGFVGSTDLKALLGSLPLPAADKGDGSFEITSPQGPVRVEQKGGWAVFSNEPDLIKSLPVDPSQLLGGLDKDYGAALRVNVQNIPPQMRDMFMNLVKMGAEASLQQRPGEDENDFALRKGSTQAILKQLDQVAHDLDQLTLGLAVDTEAKAVHLDATVTFVADSKLAKAAGEKSSGKSDFAGFLQPNAAFNLNFSQKLGADDIAQLTDMLKAGRTKVMAQLEKDPNLSDETTQKAAKQLVDQLFDIGESTIKGGKIDGGAALILDPSALTFAAGGFVSDGSEVEKMFKKLVELGQADPNFPPVKFDVETYKGVRFHNVAIPMNDAQGKQLFGDTLDVYLAVGDHSTYVAFGKGSVALLKSVIDKSSADASETLPPFQMNVALTPIVKFVDTIQPGNPATSAIAQILAATGGKDHLKINAKMIENGATYRIEAEEGVLKVLGLAAKIGKGQHP